MRCLVLNIGNSSLRGGIFKGGRLVSRFCFPVRNCATARGFSETLALELAGGFDRAALCSVVPELTAKLCHRIARATGCEPLVLRSSSSHGLRIGYRAPWKLGTDRLAAAIGARALHPGENAIVVDCGTATTVTALRKDGLLCGGAIMPGVGLWSEVLASRTAQLPAVKPCKPRSPVGRTPEEAIASGLYHGHVGAIRNLVESISDKAFGNEPCVILGTGGQASIFAREKLFTRLHPDLILRGLLVFAAQPHAHA
jgi:type III pantothenate kinase